MARPLSEAARTKMLQAAQQIIARMGVDACTVDEVARESGVAKTTIYRHFRNADELSINAVERMISDMVTPDTGSLHGDLLALSAGYARLLRGPTSRRLLISMLHKAQDEPKFEQLFRKLHDVEDTPVRRILQRAIARGEVDPEIDLDVAITFVKGPFVVRRLLDMDRELSEADIAAFVDLVVKALAPAAT